MGIQQVKPTLTVGVALLLLLLSAVPAAANSGPPRYLGDQSGVIVPGQESRSHVDSKTLTFDLHPGLASARVEAVYSMTNMTADPIRTELAFVFLSGGRAPENRQAIVQVDSSPVDFHLVTDHDLFAPLVREWIDGQPAVRALLEQIAGQRSYTDVELQRLASAVAAAGVSAPEHELHHLIDFHLHSHPPGAVPAARLLMPDLVREMTQGWSVRDESAHPRLDPVRSETRTMHFYGADRSMQWLIFELFFAPGVTRTITAAYNHTPTTELREYIHPVYQYEYLLSPARSWGFFGPLTIEVRLPESVFLTATVPPEQDGSIYRAKLPGQPDDELFFAVMSRQGVVFGRTQPMAYWTMLLALLLLLTLWPGWLLGRWWYAFAARSSGSTPRWPVVVLLSLFGSGILGVLINVLLLALILWIWPLPRSTDPIALLGALFLIVFATAGTVVASGVAATVTLAGRKGPALSPPHR